MSEDWEDIKLTTINTVYAESRDELGSKGLKKIKRFLKYRREIINRIREEDISVLILTPGFFLGAFIKDALLIRAVKKKTQAKVIAWVHMDPARLEFENRSSIFKKFAMHTIELVDLWVACAPSLLNSWPKWIAGKKIAIANIIPDPLKGMMMASQQNTYDVIRIGYLSAMDPEKGWRDLFQAAQSLCEKYTHLEFDFYGGVGQRETQETMEKVFRESGYTERIRWHGAVYGEDKANAYRSMDLFIFPSHTEQFPLTILEAMAYGLPIISTDVGAVKDALNSQNLISTAKPDTIESAIIERITDPRKLVVSGQGNRERYEQYFSDTVVSQQWYNTCRG
ncbi:MAG: glycosyltransferase family 4 protein [Akkermansiaceae bacterium]